VSGWSSVHTVVKESDFWSIIDQLKAKGAQGILVVPIEKMVL
jgi:ATP phosphoribosyltransferase